MHTKRYFLTFYLFLAFFSLVANSSEKNIALSSLIEKANNGDVEMQYIVGGMYFYGQGVEKDVTKSVKWLKKAASNGHLMSQLHVGNMYYRGDGVIKDWSEAIKWFELVARAGNTEVQFLLGSMYNKGEGIKVDYVNSYMYYNIASISMPAARTSRYYIEQKMTPEQIEEAQIKSREWVNKYLNKEEYE